MRKPSAPPPPDLDDIAAFHAAVADAQPIKSQNRVQLTPPGPAPWQAKATAAKRAALDTSVAAQIGLQDRLDDSDGPNYLGPSLAQSILRDLRRGRWAVEDEIDLHGYNRDEARAALASFLVAALTANIRCIRVVHGKGLSVPGKTSVLRQLVRGWLMQREEILAYCQARPQDGGEGALIALLRAVKTNRFAQ